MVIGMRRNAQYRALSRYANEAREKTPEEVLGKEVTNFLNLTAAEEFMQQIQDPRNLFKLAQQTPALPEHKEDTSVTGHFTVLPSLDPLTEEDGVPGGVPAQDPFRTNRPGTHGAIQTDETAIEQRDSVPEPGPVNMSLDTFKLPAMTPMGTVEQHTNIHNGHIAVITKESGSEAPIRRVTLQHKNTRTVRITSPLEETVEGDSVDVTSHVKNTRDVTLEKTWNILLGYVREHKLPEGTSYRMTGYYKNHKLMTLARAYVRAETRDDLDECTRILTRVFTPAAKKKNVRRTKQ